MFHAILHIVQAVFNRSHGSLGASSVPAQCRSSESNWRMSPPSFALNWSMSRERIRHHVNQLARRGELVGVLNDTVHYVRQDIAWLVSGALNVVSVGGLNAPDDRWTTEEALNWSSLDWTGCPRTVESPWRRTIHIHTHTHTHTHTHINIYIYIYIGQQVTGHDARWQRHMYIHRWWRHRADDVTSANVVSRDSVISIDGLMTSQCRTRRASCRFERSPRQALASIFLDDFDKWLLQSRV